VVHEWCLDTIYATEGRREEYGYTESEQSKVFSFAWKCADL
jgi:hypothetical protein